MFHAHVGIVLLAVAVMVICLLVGHTFGKHQAVKNGTAGSGPSGNSGRQFPQ